MKVRLITELVKVLVNGRVDIRDPPGLTDRHSDHPMRFGPKAVHAPVKVSESKPKFIKEFHDPRFTPVSTSSGPFNEDCGTYLLTAPCGTLKMCPQSPVQIEMVVHSLWESYCTCT